MQKSIVYLKSGKFSIHPARGPVLVCKKDLVADVPSEHADVLDNYGWAKILETEEEIIDDEGKDDDGDKVDIVPPWEQENWDPEADDAKDMLEAYGLEVFGVDVNKRKSIDNLIVELKELKE